MKLQATIFVLAFLLCLSWQAKTQPSEPTQTLVAGIQDLCWSPEGRYIYFSGMWHKPDYSGYHPGKWSIFRYDFTTKTTAMFADSALNVVVDGTGNKIAIGKLVNGNRDIYVMDSNGKNLQRMTAHPKDEFAPSWSPDGKLIAYYLERGDHKDQIYVVNLDGSGAKNLTNDTLNNYFPGWVGNNKIIYSQDRPDKKGSRVFTVKTDGKEKQPQLNLVSFYARYSSDGTMIACIDQVERCIAIISSKGKLVQKIFLPK